MSGSEDVKEMKKELEDFEIEFEKLTARSVSGILPRGGTIIRTARSERFKDKKFRDRAMEMCKVFGIEALVVIGGDASYR